MVRNGAELGWKSCKMFYFGRNFDNLCKDGRFERSPPSVLAERLELEVVTTLKSKTIIQETFNLMRAPDKEKLYQL
jgi:hypothetical protein